MMLQRKFIRMKQFWSEQFSEDSASPLDSEFLDLRRKVCLQYKFIEKICKATSHYLQPNPFMRSKTAWTTSCFEIVGKLDPVKYPYPEWELSDAFVRFSNQLDDESKYCSSLRNCGQYLQELLQRKQELEILVKVKFLNPISQIQNEIGSIKDQLRTFDKRRLEYDYYRKLEEGNVTNQELGTSRIRFQDSKALCHELMQKFIARECDHILVLLGLARCLQDYHYRCSMAMNTLTGTLSTKAKMIQGGHHRQNNGLSDPEFLNENIYIDLSKLVLVHNPGVDYMEIDGNDRACENEYYRRRSIQQTCEENSLNQNEEYIEIEYDEEKREEEHLL